MSFEGFFHKSRVSHPGNDGNPVEAQFKQPSTMIAPLPDTYVEAMFDRHEALIRFIRTLRKGIVDDAVIFGFSRIEERSFSLAGHQARMAGFAVGMKGIREGFAEAPRQSKRTLRTDFQEPVAAFHLVIRLRELDSEGIPHRLQVRIV